jgi:hypothetical protein
MDIFVLLKLPCKDGASTSADMKHRDAPGGGLVGISAASSEAVDIFKKEVDDVVHDKWSIKNVF